MVSLTPLLAMLSSLAAVPLIALSGKRPNLREAFTFAAGITKLLLVLSMLPVILAGETVTYTLWEILPGLAIRFRVDAMGILFALVASSLWIVTTIYSIGYMRGLKEHAQTRFFCFFALALSATLGVAFAGNLLTLYLFYEILSLSTYPLVTHHQDKEARDGGRKYLSYLLASSIGFALPALIASYLLAGTLEFTGTGFLGGTASPAVLTFLLLLFVFGFAKSGLMPLHGWLPGAMVAPTPVSALLHAVAVVKVGVFSVLRVFTDVFGLETLKTLFISGIKAATIVAVLASITILLSSLIALFQDNLKRRLAYSTIGQLSYIILGAALLHQTAVAGALSHIVMHAFGKITLFFCAGAIFVATGKKYISQMVGLGRAMPFTFAAFFLGSLSVIGLPPAGGLLSKFYLILGSLRGDEGLFMIVFLVSSLLNAAYFLPITFRAFFPGDKAVDEVSLAGIREAPLWCVVPPVVTGLLSIALFFFPETVFRLASLAVGAGGTP